MLAASPIFLVLVKSGIEDISYFIQNINYVGAQGGDLQKIFNELLNWYSLFPNKILALLVVILVTFLNYKKSDLYSWSLLLLPILAYDYSAKLDIQQSLKFINNYIVFFPLLFLLHFRDKVVRKLFILIFIPSLFAGLTFIWSSSNGFYAAGLGFFPASLALSYIIVHLIHNRKTAIQSKQWLSILLPSIIIVLLIFMQNSVYRDEPIKELTAKVEFGPYKGLYTTKEKRDFLQTFSTDILSFSKHKSIFFYSHIPGGYLFSTSKPAGNTLWVFTYTKDFSVYSDYFYDYPKPEVVFRMKFMIAEDFLPITYQKDNVLNQFINNQYNIIHSNQYYDVLIENK
ncbi:hypothetical protein JOC85_002494 [Bacillus mesophilus]|uniref:Uncharacterized protein n=1 Tax=Bacillus mesophilus TaxID=1808955 RepID=A0A6M0Q7W6_9BACI|nr:hypothetical protein [Bacillus mesophilus]MBM7661691.1 hypothetical protein [Bacillus mesophilus]NEY72353.1 hypothetical protein [Bacillus mesophilus]